MKSVVIIALLVVAAFAQYQTSQYGYGQNQQYQTTRGYTNQNQQYPYNTQSQQYNQQYGQTTPNYNSQYGYSSTQGRFFDPAFNSVSKASAIVSLFAAAAALL
ncbi:unnamed protein product [Caenorhabditis bovis]|uniref:Uncharacterized protein n=1 Tax=Caenorhabditis bovis TaxID=2654633 RepID=A0A8S1E8T1_9PELO|nr:unnamed protein product [Caenorhabditis bovis]